MLSLLVPLLAIGQTQLNVMVDDIRPGQNILAYDVSVAIPDFGDVIRATAHITYRVAAREGPLVLDFDAAFCIDSIIGEGGRRFDATVMSSSLAIPQWGNVGDTLSVTVFYHGTPVDGLFIQNNVHGSRTAFADNWPDRAHHWFPSEDHPADKAYASFSIEVPAGWKAIANGAFSSMRRLESGRTVWNWRTERAISVYNMVIGAGRFAVTEMGSVDGAPQSVWVFPEDSARALNGPFRRVTDIAARYTDLIGPFPFAKLAHVESSTRFGGMENASAIFYSERGISTGRMGESTVAHEIAHQWFGAAVTEKDWHHLWLSEGFASYFGPLYYELIGDHETFRNAMLRARTTYMAATIVDRPIIDVAQDSLFLLLNANNYQKGAWVLRMLRNQMGDAAFFQGVRNYYETFRDSVVLTSDLQMVMEASSGQSLSTFFNQWLLQPGYPRLEIEWTLDGNGLDITIIQVQSEDWGLFRFNLTLEIDNGDEVNRYLVRVDGLVTQLVLSQVGEVEELRWDPDDMLLVEITEIGNG